MQPTGGLANLAERMKEKTEQERQQIENIVNTELTNLRRSLNDATKNALATIKNDMADEIRDARKTLSEQAKILNLCFAQRWLTVGLMALVILLSLAAGGLGLVKLAERKARSLHQEISQLQQQQSRLETTVQQLQAKTWGLDLLEAADGRYIILPPKAKAKTGYIHNKNRQAIKVE